MPWVYLLAFAIAGAAFGYGVGAIRSTVTLIGTFIGLALAPLAGQLFVPIFNRTAAGSPMWMYLLPPFAGFVVIFLFGMAIGFAVRKPVYLHFKHNEDDVTRESFLRLDQAGGSFVGLLIGMVLFFTFGRLSFVGGNIAAALSTESDPSGLVKWASGFRKSLDGTGFDRGFAALDRTPARVYAITETLGLLHENPRAHVRLKDYPPFMSLAEKPEFKDLADDKEYQDMLTQKQGFSPVLNHPKTQAVLSNAELTDELLKTDLADLRKFLETGDSPIYADDKYKIVGRWRVDANAVVRNAARLNENLTPDQFKKLRARLTAVLSSARVTVYPEGRMTFNMGTAPAPAEEAAAAAPAAPATTQQIDPALAARYGLRPGARQVAAPVAAKAPGAEAKMPEIKLSGDATWEAGGGKFTVKSSTGTLDAVVDEKGRLLLTIPQLKTPLVLVRVS